MLHDIRHAFRAIVHAPLAASITIVTLALGLGVVAAVFAVVDAVLLRPIVADQDRVVYVSKIDAARGDFPFPLSFPEFEAWRDQSSSFEMLAAVDHAATGPSGITVAGQVTAVVFSPVSADFFRVVHRGVPLHGRWLERRDEQPGAEVAAVVSERFWRRASGGDPAFVGRRLVWAGDRSLLVVGVAPAALDYPLGTDIWAPASRVFDGGSGRFDARNRSFTQFELIGRLRSGVSLDSARSELTVVQRRVVRQFPKDYQEMPVLVRPLLDTVTGSAGQVVIALFAAAGLVFVVAGVNVTALLLMRASRRRHELRVRAAFGASAWRLLRPVFAESVVIGAAGALGGLGVAHALIATVQRLAPAEMPRIEQASLDWRVLAFTVLATLAWLLTLGCAPAWASLRASRSARLESNARVAASSRGLAFFTAVEIAAAVVVAVGAVLLVRTFVHLQAVDRGLQSGDVFVVSLLLPEERRRDPRAMLSLYERALPAIEALPGVTSATPLHVLPGTGSLGLSAPMFFEGQTEDDALRNTWSTWEPIVPSYFRTLGIPIVGGRGFDGNDRRDGNPVAIVSEAVARQYWPGQDPVGKRLQFVHSKEWPWVTIVGVAADTRYRELTKPWMTVYFPADQFFYFQPASLAVRATTSPGALLPAILQRVREIEPAVAVQSVASMETLLGRELARPRAALTATGIFALMAIALAAIGVYGVMSYEIRQRRRELAVRAAIGAAPSDIFRAVLGRSLAVSVAGAAAGLVLAAWGTQALRSILFEVSPLDPLAFAAGGATLIAIAAAAACSPARRAARTDPAVSLRSE